MLILAEPSSNPKVPIRRMEVRAPAKVNLYLEVLGKREDGFHEVETLMCPINLCDRVLLEVTNSHEVELEVLTPAAASRDLAADTSDPAWQVPTNSDNLVVRAAQAVRDQINGKLGVRIQLHKNVPSAAGLGGGSSDAAATVVGCLALWDQWNRELALSVCSQLGSDIPFFLGSESGCGLAIGRGRGEQCEAVSGSPKLDFVVTHPPVGCSTKDIYGGYRRQGPLHSIDKIIDACETGQNPKIGAQLFNALQFYASNSNTWIGKQLELFQQCGFEFALMSGSGSSCFALYDAATEESKIDLLKTKAADLGIRRVYSATTVFSPSVEIQLANLH